MKRNVWRSLRNSVEIHFNVMKLSYVCNVLYRVRQKNLTVFKI
jgi:hypothetical protein